MARLWVTLSTKWKLEDVQAALNVIISTFSALGIFTYCRYVWLRGTVQVAKRRDVPLSALLSVTTPGEVWDAILLLGSRLFSRGHYGIVAQSVVVIILSVSAVLSGPIARFSTRRGNAITQVDVTGFLATTDFNNIIDANVAWNNTQVSLDRARFPLNQLLDYLPNIEVPWVYVPGEWNSSWKADCEAVPLTPIELSVTGNHEEPTSLSNEMPHIWNVFPPKYKDASHYMYYETIGSYHQDVWKSQMIFMISTDLKATDYSNSSISMSLAVLHLTGAPKNMDSTDATWGTGPIPYAAYDRMDCQLTRGVTPDPHHVAFPWMSDEGDLMAAYGQYYQYGQTMEVFSGRKITVPSAEELFRFYQVYMITKDTTYQQPVTRRLTANIPSVELSVFFLTIVGSVFLLILLGTAHYVWNFSRHPHAFDHTPQTKLDWILQSIKETDREDSWAPGLEYQGAAMMALVDARSSKRADFETALYGPSASQVPHGRVRRSIVGGQMALLNAATFQTPPAQQPYPQYQPPPVPPPPGPSVSPLTPYQYQQSYAQADVGPPAFGKPQAQSQTRILQDYMPRMHFDPWPRQQQYQRL